MSLPTEIQILTPNSHPDERPNHPTTIFLAGPTTSPWRETFLSLLKDATATLPNALTIYNPIQEKWDSSWRQDYATDPNFRAQTDWEMDRLDSATVVVVFFDGQTDAPVSLLELGLVARSGRAVVGCHSGFSKRGNVQAVCERLKISLEETLGSLVDRVVERVGAR